MPHSSTHNTLQHTCVDVLLVSLGRTQPRAHTQTPLRTGWIRQPDTQYASRPPGMQRMKLNRLSACPACPAPQRNPLAAAMTRSRGAYLCMALQRNQIHVAAACWTTHVPADTLWCPRPQTACQGGSRTLLAEGNCPTFDACAYLCSMCRQTLEGEGQAVRATCLQHCRHPILQPLQCICDRDREPPVPLHKGSQMGAKCSNSKTCCIKQGLKLMQSYNKTRALPAQTQSRCPALPWHFTA